MQRAKARACIGEEARSAAFIRDGVLIFIGYLEISEVIKAPTVELVKFAQFKLRYNYHLSEQKESVKLNKYHKIEICRNNIGGLASLIIVIVSFFSCNRLFSNRVEAV